MVSIPTYAGYPAAVSTRGPQVGYSVPASLLGSTGKVVFAGTHGFDVASPSARTTTTATAESTPTRSPAHLGSPQLTQHLRSPQLQARPMAVGMPGSPQLGSMYASRVGLHSPVPWITMKTPGSPTPAQQAQADVPASQLNKPAKTDFPREMKVQGKVFILTGVLGTGSFGTVYKGHEKEEGADGEEVAIKEIVCKTPKDKATAEYEAKLMKALQGNGDPLCDTPAARCARLRSRSSLLRIACPKLMATETLADGSGKWTVRIVMNRVPGLPLDDFWGKDGNKRGFSAAMVLARDFLEQMFPTLEALSPICLHRDANAHNIMLDAAEVKVKDNEADDSSPSSPFEPARRNTFTLIDFGLATDTQAWRAGEWKSKDIGGDCRYWPVSCWKQMLFGYKYVLANKEVSDEYIHNIDAHSLALTCIQLLVGVTTGTVPVSAKPIFSAWKAYWEDAVKIHKELYAVFKGNGTWANLKKNFLQQQIAEKTGRNLERLQRALEVYSHAPDAEEVAVARALSSLLSGGHEGPVDWGRMEQSLVHQTAFLGRPMGEPSKNPLRAVGGSMHLAPGGAACLPAHVSRQDLAAAASPPASAVPEEKTEAVAEVEISKKRFSHRRQHTTDAANSMARHVPEVGAGPLFRFEKANSDEKNGSPTVATNEAAFFPGLGQSKSSSRMPSSPTACVGDGASSRASTQCTKESEKADSEEAIINSTPVTAPFKRASHRRIASAHADLSHMLGEAEACLSSLASPSDPSSPRRALRKISEADALEECQRQVSVADEASAAVTAATALPEDPPTVSTSSRAPARIEERSMTGGSMKAEEDPAKAGDTVDSHRSSKPSTVLVASGSQQGLPPQRRMVPIGTRPLQPTRSAASSTATPPGEPWCVQRCNALSDEAWAGSRLLPATVLSELRRRNVCVFSDQNLKGVTAAVAELNAHPGHAQTGLAAVYSDSHKKWFLLWRRDVQTGAAELVAKLAKAAEGPRPGGATIRLISTAAHSAPTRLSPGAVFR
eukprot:TRINITY_DN101969_c0_g1_i1.p1 TRINITY_DN101969_c0_g1~~TRINITY_DN101969_c0_g1_i1.p1  ORF type:complete len:1007 (+),score=220.04 TRINITY_DN101969_c0_g1_i1:74-3094(+)